MTDPDDKYDGEIAFENAAYYMKQWSPVDLTETQCAVLLSKLARHGHIVSVPFHEMVCNQYVDTIEAAHLAADDLVRRLEGRQEATCDGGC